MKKILFSMLLSICLFANINILAKAENVCTVADPTGTPLNVRTAPADQVKHTLPNGFELDIIEIKKDSKGIEWAYVSGYYQGKGGPIGWVYMKYLDCHPISADNNEKPCIVADPTGTPLNVRSKPNGTIVTTLKNGTEVFIDDTEYIKGNPWYKVSRNINGEYKTLGWVFGKYLKCD